MVSFTREEKEDMEAKGYVAGESEVGKVYYPAQGVEITGDIEVNYVDYPWLTRFEVEGIRPL
ncbi:hypothetical protein [Mordavella massiliensis]|uniref:Uncharacterized protein n=1 Tax=Mordavella massiliensis TaxID=1871024 RepID=A0A939BFZ9_9CLOT|nr:hypothetical protein [Mordavella massiliensis]MBM6947349.1 hypothetical protein [Mordavella massiliensis]